MRWRLGLKRRFVATIEWLRWLPNPGFFPQTEQTFGTAENGSDSALLPACGREGGAQLCERVCHLERGARRLRALAHARLGLLCRIRGQQAERHGHTGLDPGQLEAAGRLAGDEVEVGR